MFQFEWKNRRGWKQYAKGVSAATHTDDRAVVASSFLLWEEHCVECSAPHCYKSCGLYANRGDGNCRRFSYGIFPNRNFSGLFGFGADIRFKRWGKLEARWPEKPLVYPVRKVRKIASIARIHDIIHWAVLKMMPTDSRIVRRALHVLRSVKHAFQGLVVRTAGGGQGPDALYIKLFSPEPQSFDLQLELIQDVPVYRNCLNVVPGWNEYTVLFEKLDFPPGKDRNIRLWVDKDREVRLIFTWLDLVKGAVKASASRKESSEKIKCVAWDLDNTLWEGVIGDDGNDGVNPVPAALELIRNLDQRGILQTIVSKNEHDIAWHKIVELGLDMYFLYPAINWEPKSANISRIARELNINVNTFALIDDSEFERGEVSSTLPQVRVYDPESMAHLLGYEEFDVPVTMETGKRRLKYLEDLNRKSAHQTWHGDLDGFLRTCLIELKIASIRHQHQIDRCLELLHRSNQFHLSGERYAPGEFEALLRSDAHDSYVLEVHDRYGDYGIVGFVSIEHTDDALIVTDFVMSCRVARKQIESAFFCWYFKRTECRGKNVFARMRVTGRNQPLRQVFDELMFEVVGETDSEIMLQVDVAKLGSKVPPVSIKAFHDSPFAVLPSDGRRAAESSTQEKFDTFQVTVVPGRELSAEHVRAWSAIQSTNPCLDSPFFRPEFTIAVSQEVANMVVGILHDPSGTPIGFLPYLLARPGFGKNLAICDYQGVIAPPSIHFDASELIRKCGLKVWEFDHLVTTSQAFHKYHTHTVESPIIDISRGFDAYKESLGPDGRRHLAKAATSARKALRELGPLTLVCKSDDARVMQAMHRWREQKYGALPMWVHRTLDSIRTWNKPEFSGVLSALYAGDDLVAVHFGVQSQSVLHWWFPAYNPDLARYAPGILLLLNMLEQSAKLGITKVDLGKGVQDYKRRFQNTSVILATGSVDLFSLGTLPRIVCRRCACYIRNRPSLLNLARHAKRMIENK